MSTSAFDVFISYSHKDLEFAARLQSALQQVPRVDGTSRRQTLRTFRDKTDAARSGYDAAILDTLLNARKLLVVCSHHASTSTFVNEEIETFAAARSAEDIVTVIAPDSAELVVPPALVSVLARPLAVDFRGLGKRASLHKRPFDEEWFKLLATLQNTTREAVERRERKRQLRRRIELGALSALPALLIGVAAVAVWQRTPQYQVMTSLERGRARLEAADPIGTPTGVRAWAIALTAYGDVPSAVAAAKRYERHEGGQALLVTCAEIALAAGVRENAALLLEAAWAESAITARSPAEPSSERVKTHLATDLAIATHFAALKKTDRAQAILKGILALESSSAVEASELRTLARLAMKLGLSDTLVKSASPELLLLAMSMSADAEVRQTLGISAAAQLLQKSNDRDDFWADAYVSCSRFKLADDCSPLAGRVRDRGSIYSGSFQAALEAAVHGRDTVTVAKLISLAEPEMNWSPRLNEARALSAGGSHEEAVRRLEAIVPVLPKGSAFPIYVALDFADIYRRADRRVESAKWARRALDLMRGERNGSAELWFHAGASMALLDLKKEAYAAFSGPRREDWQAVVSLLKFELLGPEAGIRIVRLLSAQERAPMAYSLALAYLAKQDPVPMTWLLKAPQDREAAARALATDVANGRTLLNLGDRLAATAQAGDWPMLKTLVRGTGSQAIFVQALSDQCPDDYEAQYRCAVGLMSLGLPEPARKAALGSLRAIVTEPGLLWSLDLPTLVAGLPSLGVSEKDVAGLEQVWSSPLAAYLASSVARLGWLNLANELIDVVEAVPLEQFGDLELCGLLAVGRFAKARQAAEVIGAQWQLETYARVLASAKARSKPELQHRVLDEVCRGQ